MDVFAKCIGVLHMSQVFISRLTHALFAIWKMGGFCEVHRRAEVAMWKCEVFEKCIGRPLGDNSTSQAIQRVMLNNPGHQHTTVTASTYDQTRSIEKLADIHGLVIRQVSTTA